MDDILGERRLRWLGHLIRMDQQRIPQQVLHWEVLGFRRGPRTKDLLRMGLTWEEAEVAALLVNRPEWRQIVAQCIHFDAG